MANTQNQGSSNRGFAQDPELARKAGKKGAEAQSSDAKRRGGENSHRGR